MPTQSLTLVLDCLKERLIINCTQKTVLRIMPPLCVTKADVDRAAAILDKVFTNEANKQN